MFSIVPERVRSHPQYPRALQVFRILQFIFAVVNIGLFASYIVRTAVRASNSSGAVLGILAAAITFSAIGTVISCTKLGDRKRVMTIMFVIDILFVLAYIAVSVITGLDRNRAAGSRGGRNSCGIIPPNGGNGEGDGNEGEEDGSVATRSGCSLTSASLAFSIVSL